MRVGAEGSGFFIQYAHVSCWLTEQRGLPFLRALLPLMSDGEMRSIGLEVETSPRPEPRRGEPWISTLSVGDNVRIICVDNDNTNMFAQDSIVEVANVDMGNPTAKINVYRPDGVTWWVYDRSIEEVLQ